MPRANFTHTTYFTNRFSSLRTSNYTKRTRPHSQPRLCYIKYSNWFENGYGFKENLVWFWNVAKFWFSNAFRPLPANVYFGISEPFGEPFTTKLTSDLKDYRPTPRKAAWPPTRQSLLIKWRFDHVGTGWYVTRTFQLDVNETGECLTCHGFILFCGGDVHEHGSYLVRFFCVV